MPPLHRPILWLCLGVACADGDRFTTRAGSPEGYPYAYAARSCAPWDGPAVTIFLVPSPVDSSSTLPPDAPHIELAIWRSPASLTGTTLTWPTTEQIGVLTACRDQTTCEQATAATVRFRSLPSGGSLEGHISAKFPTATGVSGGFRAVWHPERALCG
jgi:hypothetical protein